MNKHNLGLLSFSVLLSSSASASFFEPTAEIMRCAAADAPQHPTRILNRYTAFPGMVVARSIKILEKTDLSNPSKPQKLAAIALMETSIVMERQGSLETVTVNEDNDLGSVQISAQFRDRDTRSFHAEMKISLKDGAGRKTSLLNTGESPQNVECTRTLKEFKPNKR